MFRRPFALAGLALAWAAMDPASGFAQGTVALQRWTDRAVLIRNPGPGTEYYRLNGETAWDREAPRDPSLYEVRVTLPDGRFETQPLPRNQGPGSRRLTVYVPKTAVRNRLPETVQIQAEVIYKPTGDPIGPALMATIDDFPTPLPNRSADRRAFGWGRPLQPLANGAAPLPNAAPGGLRFVRIFGGEGRPGFFLADTEASNAEVRRVLADRYDPKTGRTDDFALDGPLQPAINLTPKAAIDYLTGLSQEDPTGVAYRLPTVAEWRYAASGGKGQGFWWDGDVPPAPAANFLGNEAEILEGDTTTDVRILPVTPNFVANPFDLAHTFGNVAEWASTDQPGVFARLGGHFRTDPKAAEFAAEVFDATVTGDEAVGLADDPGRAFVGVRPAFSLDADQGRTLLEAILHAEPAMEGVRVGYDPDRGTAVLTGSVATDAARHRADDLLKSAWFLAAVENQVEVPERPTNQLATLGEVTGAAPRTVPLGRWTDLVQVTARWADVLPVSGSEYWVNAFLPGGRVVSHVLPEIRPRADGLTTFPLPVGTLRSAGIADGGPVTIALSLGAPAQSSEDARIISDVKEVSWTPTPLVPPAQPGPEDRRPLPR